MARPSQAKHVSPYLIVIDGVFARIRRRCAALNNNVTVFLSSIPLRMNCRILGCSSLLVFAALLSGTHLIARALGQADDYEGSPYARIGIIHALGVVDKFQHGAPERFRRQRRFFSAPLPARFVWSVAPQLTGIPQIVNARREACCFRNANQLRVAYGR